MQNYNYEGLKEKYIDYLIKFYIQKIRIMALYLIKDVYSKEANCQLPIDNC